MSHPELILVGAGPGHPDLITIMGIKALKKADVILYDALANPALLDYASSNAVKLYVGKRAGLHHCNQQQINQMIVDYAMSHGTVIRLKGGDSFIFGRGHEEIDYAAKHGISTSVVPGISSSTGVAALNNIPLTKRHINESFWVVTGTTKMGDFSNDLSLAAQSSATIVILMGMKNLRKIMTLFKLHRSIDEPVAIIQNGTCENERKVVGNLSNIENLVKDNKIGNPAIILIGKVVNEQSLYVANSLGHLSA